MAIRACHRMIALAAALCTGASVNVLAADDEPWLLNRNNWQQAGGLPPEAVLKRVESGEYKRIKLWPHLRHYPGPGERAGPES